MTRLDRTGLHQVFGSGSPADGGPAGRPVGRHHPVQIDGRTGRPEPGYRTTMTRPGWGSPHPDLEAALAPLTPAVVRDLSWFGGALPMRAHAYLTVPRLPDELITSVRCIVEVGDRVVVCEDETMHIVPGGRREPGESIRQTAVREVHEETGWQVEPDSLRLAGFLRMERLIPAPPDHPYPHPDVLQLIFLGRATRRAADRWTDTEGYVQHSRLADRAELTTLPIAAEQLVFLGLS